MLIPDDTYPNDYDGVACDVLIFPTAEGMSDTQLNYQHRAHIKKHFVDVDGLTPEILRSLETEFVACHVSGSYTHPFWLCHSINKMIHNEATAYLKSDKLDFTQMAQHEYTSSGVVSRDLFIELLLAQRKQFFGVATYGSKDLASDLLDLPIVQFPYDTYHCDVAIPFIDRMYLNEAIDGLINQNHVNCTIHVIDDCSGQNIDDLILEYPMVRWYRNKKNIGQYLSVNNIIRSCETDFLVVNDADDVSEPNRIWLALTAMELSGADVYGSQTTQFFQDNNSSDLEHYSIKPYGNKILRRHIVNNEMSVDLCNKPLMHPIVHGSLVIRKSAFHRMNGYTNFGDIGNKQCGNDTEFIMRAFYSGCKFHIGQSESMRIRMHNSSCVNKFNYASEPRQIASRSINARIGVFNQSYFDPALFGAGFESTITKELVPH